jgi:hypothetical protein
MVVCKVRDLRRIGALVVWKTVEQEHERTFTMVAIENLDFSIADEPRRVT